MFCAVLWCQVELVIQLSGSISARDAVQGVWIRGMAPQIQGTVEADINRDTHRSM